MAKNANRHAATSIFTTITRLVRFHMGKPFLDHAGAARKGCV